MIIKAKELVKGDEVIINDELHRIVVSEPQSEGTHLTMSYVIARPLTAAFRKSWFENDDLEVHNR